MSPRKKKNEQPEFEQTDDRKEPMAIEESDQQAVDVREEVEPDHLTEHIAALESELEQLRRDVDEARDRYLRVLADFDNYKKRQREETARQINLAKEELILKLLPIVDNFQRALRAAEAQHSFESLVEGVSLTLRQLQDMLEKEGVRPIEAVGETFNPELHEALMREETDEYPENTIIDEFEKGYTMNGKVIRPARVKVATSS
ncbi:MAG: nucleotide exchange factor GrpE [Armatimonadota bacterium]|nr:nucleotide exchange factor GrpE [Armatimonadota bacterium]